MFRVILLNLALLLAGAFFLAAAAHANPDLKQLEAQLPGELVNDPSRIDWESYGGELEATAIVDKSIPGGGAARRFEIKNAKEHIYTAGTNIPLIKRVRRGEHITIGFYARTIEAKTDDGNGVLRIRFQKNAPPYPGFGEKTLSIGTKWDWYEVTAKAEMGLGTVDGIVAVQFGRTKQILEIGQAIIVSGATSIANEGSKTKAEPKVTKPAAEATLPKPLEGTGRLLNQPSIRNWGMGGTAGKSEPREEPQIWLGNATRFTTAKLGESAADLFATIPIEASLAEGDELLIAIAARTESAATDDGHAIVGIRIQDPASKDNFFANARFKVGPKWQLIRIKTRAPQAFAAGGALVALHFAGAIQAVDIGPVYVIKTN